MMRPCRIASPSDEPGPGHPRRLYGSAIVRTFVWGLAAGLQTGLLYLLISKQQELTMFFAGGRVSLSRPSRHTERSPCTPCAASRQRPCAAQ